MTLSACLGLGLARVTGDSPRAFAVLAADDEASVGGEVLSVDALAQRYRPQIVGLPQERDDPVVGMSYEAWRDGPDLVLTYFVTWADERHPQVVPHLVYGLYRWAFYRGPSDIEYVQVRVSPAGAVREVRFESAADLDPWSPRPVHVDAVAQVSGQTLVRRLSSSDGDRAAEAEGQVDADGRVTLYVATWNHLLDVVPPPTAEAGQTASPPPVRRSAADYEDVAGARRGHPLAENAQTPARALAGHVGGLLYAGSPVVGLAVVMVRRWSRS
jgi:hypothetical protein